MSDDEARKVTAQEEATDEVEGHLRRANEEAADEAAGDDVEAHGRVTDPDDHRSAQRPT